MPHNLAVSSFEPMANTYRPNTVERSTTAIKTARPSASHTPSGSGENVSGDWLLSIKLLTDSSGCSGLTVWLLASHLEMPRAMPIMPSVTMNGIMRNAVIMPPLAKPTSPPASTVSKSTTAKPWPCSISLAVTTLHSATTDPALKSIPPLTITSVIPIAPMATMTVCVRIILKLLPLKNSDRNSASIANSSSTTNSPTNGRMAFKKSRLPSLLIRRLNSVLRLMINYCALPLPTSLPQGEDGQKPDEGEVPYVFSERSSSKDY